MTKRTAAQRASANIDMDLESIIKKEGIRGKVQGESDIYKRIKKDHPKEKKLE